MTTLQVIQRMNDEIANDKARVIRLSRELAMLRKAQQHLSGIPARHNLLRIAEREDELRTLTYLLDLYSHDDMVYSEVRAALEEVAQ